MNSATAMMNCDRIARWYEPAEHLSFQRALEHRRFAYVNRLGESRRALSCGGGDGRFLAGLLQANPSVQVTYIDLSREMMRIAERRIARLGDSYRSRVEFFCADVMTFVPPHSDYDLFATHFFLDCFTREDAHILIERMMEWAHPDANWVLSEFRYSPSAFGKLWTGAIIRALYAAFRVTTGLRVNRIPQHPPLLVSAGFQLQESQIAMGGLLISELWKYQMGTHDRSSFGQELQSAAIETSI
ncbi:MAG TPA: class I SAM-dependent methyltransferase [Candidatus Dormibacteraeota bacterium]|nr:class I SAM-dependent methyltransferase [Candidatus Dormibacteraeota bacterium]